MSTGGCLSASATASRSQGVPDFVLPADGHGDGAVGPPPNTVLRSLLPYAACTRPKVYCWFDVAFSMSVG